MKRRTRRVPPLGPVARLLLALLVGSGCAGRTVPPIGAGGQPFRPDAAERALWAEAEKEEGSLQKKVPLYDDAMLEAYLARVGDRLVPAEARVAGGPRFRFTVVRDPTLGAFAMPNGRVYVHTGLLSRIENEAQLATILGREMTHVEHRHALALSRGARNERTLSTLIGAAASAGVAAAGSRAQRGDGLGGAVLGPAAGAMLGLGLELAAIASMNGYGPVLERDADRGGIESLVRAGYDPREAPKLFALLERESRDGGPLETFFYGDHRKLQERFDTTTDLLQTEYAAAAARPGTITDAEEFRLRTRAVVRDNVLLDVHAGRFALAQRQLDRVLAATPEDPLAHLYEGELHRLKSQRASTPAARAEEARLARASYERSAQLDPTLPDPYRQLGLLYYQEKDAAKAREAFRRYLALRPDAPDARRIQEYLALLHR